MAKKLKLRPTAWGLAVAAFDVWRRLPPKQRKQAIILVRKHGPTLAKQVVKRGGGGGKAKKK
jgi:hypothetical protein